MSVELEEYGGLNAINTAPGYLLDQLNAVFNPWLSRLQQEPMDEEGDHDDLLRGIAAVLRTSSRSCVAAVFNIAASRQWGFDVSGAAFMVRPSWLCEVIQEAVVSHPLHQSEIFMQVSAWQFENENISSSSRHTLRRHILSTASSVSSSSSSLATIQSSSYGSSNHTTRYNMMMMRLTVMVRMTVMMMRVTVMVVDVVLGTTRSTVRWWRPNLPSSEAVVASVAVTLPPSITLLSKYILLGEVFLQFIVTLCKLVETYCTLLNA